MDRSIQPVLEGEFGGQGDASAGDSGFPFWLRRALVDGNAQWSCASGKAVPKLLDQLCKMNDGAEIGRIVVIDAEGNSVPFLKGLKQGKPARGWVTRLKPSMLNGKRIFNRTNYQAYRDGDRVGIGLVDLNEPDEPEKPFRIRVIEVERRTKGMVTCLGPVCYWRNALGRRQSSLTCTSSDGPNRR